MRPIQACKGCGELKKMTAHHVFPKRHFGKGPRNNYIYLICRTCHTELEAYIPYRLMPKAFYSAILAAFLKEKGHGT